MEHSLFSSSNDCDIKCKQLRDQRDKYKNLYGSLIGELKTARKELEEKNNYIDELHKRIPEHLRPVRPSFPEDNSRPRDHSHKHTHRSFSLHLPAQKLKTLAIHGTLPPLYHQSGKRDTSVRGGKNEKALKDNKIHSYPRHEKQRLHFLSSSSPSESSLFASTSISSVLHEKNHLFPDCSSDSAFLSDEDLAWRLQEEDNNVVGLDDETYAKILQDIENKRTSKLPFIRLEDEPISRNQRMDEDLALMGLRSTALSGDPPSTQMDESNSQLWHRNQSSDLTEDNLDMSYETLVGLEDVACGLDPSVIECLPRYPVSATMLAQSATCVICLGDYYLGDEITTLLCLHMFHFECLSHCWKRKKSCPVCKKGII